MCILTILLKLFSSFLFVQVLVIIFCFVIWSKHPILCTNCIAETILFLLFSFLAGVSHNFLLSYCGSKASILRTNCFTETFLFSFLFLQVLVTILYLAIGSKAPNLCTNCITETILFFSYRCSSQFSA